jgi:hypothetical protein
MADRRLWTLEVTHSPFRKIRSSLPSSPSTASTNGLQLLPKCACSAALRDHPSKSAKGNAFINKVVQSPLTQHNQKSMELKGLGYSLRSPLPAGKQMEIDCETVSRTHRQRHKEPFLLHSP